MNHRECGYALMRVTYGVIFLFYGIGLVMLGQADKVAHNLIYVLANFALLWFSDLNRLSVDGLFAKKQPAGFTN